MHQGVQNLLNSMNLGGPAGGKRPDEPVPAGSGRDTGAHRAQRAARPEGTRVKVGAVEIGGPGFVVMAGPCAVEGAEQVERAAAAVASAGAHILRGGVFKPRTSPYAFQGMGE